MRLGSTTGRAYRLSLVPRLDVTEEVVGTGGELELEVEPEEAVDVLHEVEKGRDFLLDLPSQVGEPPGPSHSVWIHTCDGKQKTCESSCTNRRTRVRPVSAPEASLR